MNRLFAWGLIGSILVLAGCSNDMSDLDKYIADKKAEPPQPIPPLKDITQVEPFLYQAGDRRDPFSLPENPVEATETAANTGVLPPDPTRPKQELEQYPLDSLHMVGTIEQDGIMWGLIIIEGGLYRVKAGNYAGQNYGQITNITENRIELTEIIPDSAGGWQERQAAINLTESTIK